MLLVLFSLLNLVVITVTSLAQYSVLFATLFVELHHVLLNKSVMERFDGWDNPMYGKTEYVPSKYVPSSKQKF